MLPTWQRLYCSSMASEINSTVAFCYPPPLSAQAHFSAPPCIPQEALRAIPALTEILAKHSQRPHSTLCIVMITPAARISGI